MKADGETSSESPRHTDSHSIHVWRHLHDGIGMLFGNEPLCMSCDFYFFQGNKTCPSQISSDVSNLVKFVEDSFNKVLYNDDRQIVSTSDSKHFTGEDYEYTVICLDNRLTPYNFHF